MKQWPFIARNLGSIILLACLIVTAGLLFFAQISAPPPAQTSSAALSALEFALSVSIGWVLQRIASPRGASALPSPVRTKCLRKITDIRRSVARVLEEIDRISGRNPSASNTDLDVIRVTAEQLLDTVQLMVLGLGGYNRRGPAEGRPNSTPRNIIEVSCFVHPPSAQSSVSTNDIKAEIDRLREDIPYLLPAAPCQRARISFPREGRYSATVAAHFRRNDRRRRHYLPQSFAIHRRTTLTSPNSSTSAHSSWQ